MEKEKRNIRTYKVKDKSYFGAQVVCNNEDLPLSNVLEVLVDELNSGSAISLKLLRQLKRLKK